jgi:hypothetical protein
VLDFTQFVVEANPFPSYYCVQKTKNSKKYSKFEKYVMQKNVKAPLEPAKAV